MSSSFWWNDEDFNGKVLNQVKPKDVTIYLDSGDQGPSQDDKPQTIAVREHLLKMPGFKMNETLFYYLDRGGEHNEKYWRERFWIPMKDLYPVSVNPITPH
jgi:predicted alpha/beta superfamily hydrolase